MGVTTVEFRMDVRSSTDAPKIPVRLIASNPTGYVLKVETYVEISDPDTNTTTFNVMTPELAASYEKFTEATNKATTTKPSQMRKMVSGGHQRLGSVVADVSSSQLAESWMQGAAIMTPYPISNPIEKNRQTASRITDTIYCYDYI